MLFSINAIAAISVARLLVSLKRSTSSAGRPSMRLQLFLQNKDAWHSSGDRHSHSSLDHVHLLDHGVYHSELIVYAFVVPTFLPMLFGGCVCVWVGLMKMERGRWIAMQHKWLGVARYLIGGLVVNNPKSHLDGACLILSRSYLTVFKCNSLE